MKKRVISGIFIILILGICMFIGKLPFYLLMSFISLAGIYEFINIKYDNKKLLKFPKYITYIFTLLMTLNNTFYTTNVVNLIILLILSLTIPLVIYNDKDKYNINDTMYLIGTSLILSLAFNSLIKLKDINIYLCLYVFIISFMTDTYAYIGGMLIGRNKLTTISPKKTIEGSVVGTVMATIIGSVFYNILIGDHNLYLVILFSLALSIVSQFGDLFFSVIKRYFDKKDYSNLIPGHGGILDRLDSVIFVTLLLDLIISIF